MLLHPVMTFATAMAHNHIHHCDLQSYSPVIVAHRNVIVITIHNCILPWPSQFGMQWHEGNCGDDCNCLCKGEWSSWIQFQTWSWLWLPFAAVFCDGICNRKKITRGQRWAMPITIIFAMSNGHREGSHECDCKHYLHYSPRTLAGPLIFEFKIQTLHQKGVGGVGLWSYST